MKRKLPLIMVLVCLVISSVTFAAYPLGEANNTTAITAVDQKINTNYAAVPTTKKGVKKELAAQSVAFGGGKSKIVAALLAFFIGSLGVHSFYMGQTVKGFIQLGLSVLGIALYIAGIASFVSGTGAALPVTALIGAVLLFGVGLWAFVDFVRILIGGLEPEEGFND